MGGPITRSKRTKATFSCGTCSQTIVDKKTSSIACDICLKWFHAEKTCSGINKDIYSSITKDDKWACYHCIDYFGMFYGRDVSSLIDCYDETQKELMALKIEKENLMKNNDDLSLRLIECERRLTESQDLVAAQVKIGNEKERWQKPKKVAMMKGADGEALANEVQTSNSFQALTEDIDIGSMESFPPLNHNYKEAHRKRNKEQKCKERLQRKKVRLVGDSHARRCFGRIKSWADADLTAAVMPGKSLSALISRAKEQRLEERQGETVVMVGGTNRVSEESIERLGSEMMEMEKCRGQNVVWVETPMRHDDLKQNPLIKKQNKTIKEKCLELKWTYLNLNALLDRGCYTSHGLHLNARGKDVLCGLISAYLMAAEPREGAILTKNWPGNYNKEIPR